MRPGNCGGSDLHWVLLPFPLLNLGLSERLIAEMKQPHWPVEVRSLGRTLKHWRAEIIAWHKIQISNGPTAGANHLIKRVKRVAFGFRSFRNFRVRVLLYARRPDWTKLAGIKPR
jgi:transposase